MIRTLSHTSFAITPAAADMRPCASALMTETGLTMVKDPNPNALALRHAP